MHTLPSVMGGGCPVVHDVISDVQPIQIYAMSSIALVRLTCTSLAQNLYIDVMYVREEVVAVPVIVS